MKDSKLVQPVNPDANRLGIWLCKILAKGARGMQAMGVGGGDEVKVRIRYPIRGGAYMEYRNRFRLDDLLELDSDDVPGLQE